MVTAARVMAMAMRWPAMKRAVARAARAISLAMRMAGNKEVDVKGGKGDGNGNDGGGQQRGQWSGRKG